MSWNNHRVDNPAGYMESSFTTASAIFDALIGGRERDRAQASEDVKRLRPGPELSRLRLLLVNALSEDFSSQASDYATDPRFSWTRGWMVNTLGILGRVDEESAALAIKHLDAEFEHERWVRYWALAGLAVADLPTLKQVAESVRDQDQNDLVRDLALAILASKGDLSSAEAIDRRLARWEDESPWSMLRALRIVFVPLSVQYVCTMVKEGGYSDAAYDAIVALGNVPSTSVQAPQAANTLSAWILDYRSQPIMDGMRANALRALANLRVDTVAPLLVEELLGDNPTIAREAARALENTLGAKTAASRILEVANKPGRYRIEEGAAALRWMDRDAVVEELEAVMVSGSASQQDLARALLSEMGGASAFQKLQARTTAMARYSEALAVADARIRELFETSIQEARGGFKLATLMDVVVFLLGVSLIAVSAGLVLWEGGTLDSWAGVGLTGGIGVLGVVYAVLISNPRKQVESSVDHLMYLKVVFLAYLRQLHQTDQAYTRRLLDEEPLAPTEVEAFTRMVGETMSAAVEQLSFARSTMPQPNDGVPDVDASNDPPSATTAEPRTPSDEESLSRA